MNKPSSKKMIEQLMDCHEIELMELESCNAGTLKFSRALIRRGWLSARQHISGTGKSIVAL